MKSLFIDHIHDVFEQRKQRNPLYSLRSFARDLDLSSGKLSEMMRGKIKVSEKAFHSISQCLDLNDSIKIELLDELKKYNEGRITLQDYDEEIDFTKIFSHTHLAISALFDLPFFNNDLEWMADTLKITTEQCQSCLDDLVLSGLISFENDVYVKNMMSGGQIKRPNKDSYKQYFQTGLLNAAQATINRDKPLHWFNSSIIPMNANNFKSFKEKMRVVIEELNFEVSDEGEEAEDVFHLMLACYPMTSLSDKTTLN